MKKILVSGVLLVITLGFIYLGYRLSTSATVKIFLMKSEMKERFEEPVLGIYDRHKNISQAKARSLRHYALILNNDAHWEIEENLLDSLSTEIPVLLTVEMWDSSILKKVANGDYDANIKTFFSEILDTPREMYIRWNPEMDVPAGYHAWEMTPQHYIPAFNRFSQIIKKISPESTIIWGPAGYPGALENYPEDEMVDAASVTLNGVTEGLLNQKQHATPYSLQRKLHRLRFIDKPIFILGVHNTTGKENSEDLISDALHFITSHKQTIYAQENFPGGKVNKPETFKPSHLGVYDPSELLVLEEPISIEHIFTNFTEIENGKFNTAVEEVLGRGNDLLITLEPGLSGESNTVPNLLESVYSCKFDSILQHFYSILPAQDHQVYLRFAHEMEIPITRYGWQSKDPVEYIKAYRHFAQFNKVKPHNISYIWGPAGDRGSLEWWPGNDVVDYISISIYGLPDKNITDPEKQETFSRIFYRKTQRLRFVDKPLFIAEFGVKGNEDFQNQWLKGAAETINDNLQIFAVSYFNNSDVPEAWGEIKPPDWKISKKSFSVFVNSLNKKTL